MTILVLDASITMRWFFDAGAHSQADAVLNELTSASSKALVPVLWCYEVSAVLARAQSKGLAAADDVADFIEDLEALPIHLEPESAAHVFADVHRLAVAHGLTSYDAAYLELAQRRNVPLATLDAELVAACSRAGVAVF